MNYYEVGYDKMNIDGIYGLRLLEGKGPFTHSSLRTYIKTHVSAIKTLSLVGS